MKENLLVVEETFQHLFADANVQVLDALAYISKDAFVQLASANVYALGNLSSYQTANYYVCLLGEARKHRVFPNITLIQDLKYKNFHSFYTDELNYLVQKRLKKIQSEHFELSCYFGSNLAASYAEICAQFYKVIQAPMFRVCFSKINGLWTVDKIKLLKLSELSKLHLEFVSERAKAYFATPHRYRKQKSKNLFDVAIWTNPEESHPPSNAKAIEKFIEAGHELQLNVEVMTKKESSHLLEYDGLFIRETTKLNHNTYRVSRKADSEGLVVVDDPQSIIKCTNKIYLEELLNRLKIKRPKSIILHKQNYRSMSKSIVFPVILKIPDSAFSLGVFKVGNRDAYIEKCKELFKHSDLVLLQEFLVTDYDWRIGILGGKAIYACKYFMAKQHWQIIDNSKANNNEGDHACVAIEKVPPKILAAAMQASKAIGSGLYGVDLKEVNGEAFLIEVNDNPNIDAGVEDGVLGDQLYVEVMHYFLQRFLEKRGGFAQV